jgi:hypothetical protein
MSQLPSPRHGAVRSFLRIGGPLLAVTGLGFLSVGVVSFFSAFQSGGMPGYFWCAFVGMPLLFVGGVMTQLGYLGSITRYVAAEQTPVAIDAVNDVVEGTKGSVKTLAKAVTEGIDEARRGKR